MSYAFRPCFSGVLSISRSLLVATSVTLLAACGSAPSEETGTTSSADLDEGATLTFASDFTDSSSAPLVVGNTVTIAYDASRLPTCRGNADSGEPGWSITAFYRIDGGAVSSVTVAGLNPDPTAQPTFTLSAAGDLEMWFQATSMWGCSAWDSAFGANYHFTVFSSENDANAPGWVGDAEYVISRETCAPGEPCASDFQSLDAGFTYDTWVRSQAAIRRAYFEVWKQGVTDFDNPNLWQELDVEVHSRVGSNGDFAMAYVSFDSRDGNNSRYALDLSTLDPLPGGPSGSALTDTSECPQFPVSYEGQAGDQMIEADLQFYFTVNGTELRPADGTVFHGTYENYAGLYAVCQ